MPTTGRLLPLPRCAGPGGDTEGWAALAEDPEEPTRPEPARASVAITVAEARTAAATVHVPGRTRPRRGRLRAVSAAPAAIATVVQICVIMPRLIRAG